MKYWLCVTDRENWEIIKNQKIWGVPRRRRATIEKVTVGDCLVIYTMPGQIRGIFKAASKPFESEEEVFKPVEGEIFPYRVRLKAVLVPKDPTDFRPLIPKLTFIKKKRMWGFFVRTAMREIPEGDYRTIESALV